jgi:hypothetical protein
MRPLSPSRTLIVIPILSLVLHGCGGFRAGNPVLDAAVDDAGAERSGPPQGPPSTGDGGMSENPRSPDASAVDGPDGPSNSPPGDAVRAAPVCGNGLLETGEQCDPPATCPTTCPSRGCTRFALTGSAAMCSAACAEAGPVTTCGPTEGCCPAGCTPATDGDCSVRCGDGKREGQETCDPVQSCPTACPPVACQLRKLVNGGTCTAECVDDARVTTCARGDGCCPLGCNSSMDNDCAPNCGNGVVESGETCDPVSQCETRKAACSSDQDRVRTPMGDSAICTFACIETARQCGPMDRSCPTGCGPAQDPDCKKAAGAACNAAAECASGACTDGFCCAQPCAPCQACRGAGGTCTSLPAGSQDTNPPGACESGVCDGASPPRCVPLACAAGERKCEGNAAFRCKADRTGFQLEQSCAGMQPYCFGGVCTGCKDGFGACGDGLCPESCPGETESVCQADCGQIAGTRPGSTGLPDGESSGECGAYQAVFRVEIGDALWCTKDNAKFAHSRSTCRVVGWEPVSPAMQALGFTAGSRCAANEFVVGFGHAGERAVVCCRGPVDHRDCRVVTGGSCVPGQYVANRFIGDTYGLECCYP